MLADFFDVGFEGVGHGEWGLASELEDGPVDHIMWKASFERRLEAGFFIPFFADEFFYQFTAAKGTGIAWRVLHGEVDRCVGCDSWNATFLFKPEV